MEIRKTDTQVGRNLRNSNYGWRDLSDNLERFKTWYNPSQQLSNNVYGYHPIPEFFSTMNNKLELSSPFNALDYMFPEFKDFPFDYD